MNNKIQRIIVELEKWYFQEWFIGVLCALFFVFGILTGVGILGLAIPTLIILKKRRLKTELYQYLSQLETVESLAQQIEGKEQILQAIRQEATERVEVEVTARYQQVEVELASCHQQIKQLEQQIEGKEQILQAIRQEATERVEIELAPRYQQIEQLEQEIEQTRLKANEVEAQLFKAEKQFNTQKKKLEQIKSIYEAVQFAINLQSSLSEEDVALLAEFIPTTSLHIHSMDVKELRQEFRANEKTIQAVLKRYQSGYTTKTNRMIYDLMVLALSAELQNILYNLKYTNLDKSEDLVRTLTQKYRALVEEGNQNIAPTMKRCIAELEHLYLKAVQIEYKYYIAKEKQKNEQAALREQMRQEAEERKQLEAQRKMIEKEESKYLAEIEKAQEQLKLQEEQGEASQQLLEKIAQLEAQLKEVEVQKDEVVKRQNGKAGYVYVISNLGSFGENTFKIGMTRRLDPMDRVKELGDASVPFVFDVHSFIFSDDAVGLEQRLHQALNDRRVNKINLRKEFFHVSLDELEEIVLNIDPTVEFTRTMIAEEYRQSLALAEPLN